MAQWPQQISNQCIGPAGAPPGGVHHQHNLCVCQCAFEQVCPAEEAGRKQGFCAVQRECWQIYPHDVCGWVEDAVEVGKNYFHDLMMS